MGRRYRKATEFGSLLHAADQCCNGVRWKDGVIFFEDNICEHVAELYTSLQKGTYKLRPYKEFVIREPKTRIVTATQLHDRVVQKSICQNGFTEQISRSFIYDSGACQKGKGVDFQLNRVKCHLEKYFRENGTNQGWVYLFDLHDFFGSTRHEVACAADRKRLRDREIANHACTTINSFKRGTGLGSEESQLTQLAVLDDVDHMIKEKLRIKHYFRYQDDFVLIHSDRAYLVQCGEIIRDYLESIGLELNRKTNLHPLKDGFRFLQWKFDLLPKGKVIMRPADHKITKERRKLKKQKKLLEDGKITMAAIRDSYRCWKANISRGNTHNLLLMMDRLYLSLFGEVAPNVLRKKKSRYRTRRSRYGVAKRYRAGTAGSAGIHCNDGGCGASDGGSRNGRS